MDTFAYFHRLAVALAIGLIIGLERGWKAREEGEGDRTAGLRTHGLAGLLGGVWGALATLREHDGLIALALGFATYAAGMILFFYRETEREGRHDATDVVAAMLVFTLGAFAVAGNSAAAAAAAVASTALLALKRSLHAWLRRLTWEELRSAIILLAMTTVMLPILPNHAIDPMGAVNPYEIWLMTVLIAAISFAGYVAVKLLGDRSGVAVTGLAGGLVSSTAVTASLAQRAAAEPEKAVTLAGGAIISCATMVARVIAIVGIVNVRLLDHLVLPLAVACAVLAVAGIYFISWRSDAAKDNKPMALGNPLDVWGVLKFGALLTVIIVASKIATRLAGEAGAYGVAVLSGIADVDAVTLTMSRLAGLELEMNVAARAIAIVVCTNTLVKVVLGATSGGRAFGMPMTISSAAALVAGITVALAS